jgi:hypothetical protein
MVRWRGTRGTRLRALRPEVAWGHPGRRMKDPIERRKAVEAAGASDFCDLPPWGLKQQPAAQADALRGHGLGKAHAGAFEQHVHVTDRNPEQIGQHCGRQGRLRQMSCDQSARERQAAHAQCQLSPPACRRDDATRDQRQRCQRLDQRRCPRRVAFLRRRREVGKAGFKERRPAAVRLSWTGLQQAGFAAGIPAAVKFGACGLASSSPIVDHASVTSHDPIPRAVSAPPCRQT